MRTRQVREYPIGRRAILWYGANRLWWGAVRDADGNQVGAALFDADRHTCADLTREAERAFEIGWLASDLEDRLEEITAPSERRHAIATFLEAAYRSGALAVTAERDRARPVQGVGA